MNTAPSTNKRRRTDAEPEQDTLVNHQTLFREDGNTIIQCESTLFRIHSGLLASCSRWFSEFFTPEREHKDALLFLNLDVGSEDMAAFLTAVYDELLPDPVLTVQNCLYFFGVLKIAHKYGAESIKDAVLARLQATWPAKLEDHIGRVQQVLREGTSAPAGHVMRRPNPAKAIATLRSIDFSDPILLAPLFYDLNNATTLSTDPRTLGCTYRCLSFPDIERVVIGNASLAAKHVALSVTPPVLLDVSDHQSTCHAIVDAFWVTAVRILMNAKNRLAQPIFKWWIIRAQVEGSLKQPVEFSRLCEVCRFELLQHVLRCQNSLWASLDECYLLPPATAGRKP